MTPTSPHPSAEDLANLAREELGRKKTQRILDHCRECPECAELLLEAVSNQPMSRERISLSKWNWISIIILVVALIAVFGLLLWLLRGAAPPPPEAPASVELAAETVYRETPRSWFEALFAHAIVSPAEDTMLRVDSLDVRLIDLRSGDALDSALRRDFDGVMAATFDGNGALARFANRRRDLGWFVEHDGEMRRTSLPADAVPVWAPGNADVAWTRPPGGRLFLGYPPQHRSYDAGGRVLGMAWGPSGDEVFALVMDDTGVSTLIRARRATTRIEVIRAGLDASALPNSIAVSPDGESVFVALASAHTPDPEARHRPAADRDLDIYAVDTGGGLRRVVGSPGDEFWPVVAGESLYWTHNQHRAAVALLPLQTVAETSRSVPVIGDALGGADAQLPAWAPRGGQLAFTRGSWRLADWGLSFDAMVVTIDDEGHPGGDPEPLVAGYHQDLTPAWSPDGRWIAYRSRRSERPVPYYAGPGVADDIFLRQVGGGAVSERRLTDSGWEVGNPSWSPDGRRLVFDSWERTGVPRVSRPWIITIDPASGEVLDSDRLSLPAGVSGSVSAVWSPVADELLLIERQDPESQTLWLTGVGEEEATRLVDFASRTVGGADWTPDGASVVYAALVEGRMQPFVISREGGRPRRLTQDSADLMHPSVSPDGRWLAVTRLEQQKAVRRIPLQAMR
jgi:hypothetical protein